MDIIQVVLGWFPLEGEHHVGHHDHGENHEEQDEQHQRLPMFPSQTLFLLEKNQLAQRLMQV